MEEPISCSPEKKNPKTGMFQRNIVDNCCTPDCEHYMDCIKKHKVKNGVFPVWEEKESTPEELKNNICHFDWKDGKYKTWHLKQ